MRKQEKALAEKFVREVWRRKKITAATIWNEVIVPMDWVNEEEPNLAMLPDKERQRRIRSVFRVKSGLKQAAQIHGLFQRSSTLLLNMVQWPIRGTCSVLRTLCMRSRVCRFLFTAKFSFSRVCATTPSWRTWRRWP